ncbi:hypothetical protein PHYSODRAFT_301786 [Phytophthora sojae]|uniref:Uncharacterized protein n=1 Tax=Phytophthora sojae (strain P6497) TaxID=1094619 RepID=G4ZP80_PHYSP|nr:hypothetical protein PHYSODRAFT_301786 [Phytophthora sojae]EGZ15120.1 hypothetical protein PHYSODRAFT_301786 [Phytophthora sojae]|eukprot:XP_009528869.1 hypothetical protein PHYSODRAFT_301786 [Phytophthora sojae]
MSREHRDKERKHSRKSSSRRSSSRKEEDDRSSRHKSHKSSHHGKEHTKLPKGAKKVTDEDYFVRQTEFRVWLAQSKGKYVDDLSTDEAMELFTDEFAKKWNRGKLAKMFYEGLPESVVEQTKRTRHRWGFVAKLGEKEKFELATAKDSVGVATRKENLLSSGKTRESKGPSSYEEGRSKRDKRREKDEDREDEREGDRKRRKLERRREREYRDTVMEELAPKATGREAQIEKRRQLGQKLHGAARDREDARDGLDLSEDFLMGGGRGAGDDDLKRRMAQRDSARRRKQDEQQEKLAELKAKESARMDKFLEDMGLAGANANGGKPMIIPPRR